ncbi:serine acetyltransferase 1, chloroplastic-like [Gastrolobium bilobum]|uniref:serine acetyltransferase 1, chloroplastic-like n=1 Tax=Gastrolobium bilobum TaxID=150636 RepID=UPI002AAFF6E1|nr:serine acetyltransferase 1, chloroplastic-like [Gastrolobium bilobum]
MKAMVRGCSLTSLVTPTPKLFVGHPFSPLRFKSMASCVDASRSQTHEQDHSRISRPSFADRVPSLPICKYRVNTLHTRSVTEEVEVDEAEGDVWVKMQDEARFDVTSEPILSSYYQNSILSHESLESALANHLAMKLSSSSLQSGTLCDLFVGVLEADQNIMDAVKNDLRAVNERDPACISHVHCFLNFKGFLACQAHRVAHKFWLEGRRVLAVMIQNRVSEVFGVDFHPGAKIGSGILLDHATGIVVGETAVIGNDVSILHSVTLGGTGKVCGDRHPKIGDGVLIGAGSCILGNIKIGDGAKIGAGSVVIKEVPPRTTVVGNPAKLIGGKNNPIKLDKIPSLTMDHTSHFSDFYDYCV